MRYTVLFFIIFLIACRQDQTKEKAFEFYPPLPDSIKQKYLLPETRIAQFFNLPSIYTGVDSFEMRIRYWDVFGLGANLYILKVDSQGWKGYHYNAYTAFHTKEDGTTVKFEDRLKIGDSVFIVKQLSPVCGWTNFMDSITSFKLQDLPAQALIKNFKPVHGFADGDGYSIEIATKHSYRLLIYTKVEFYNYNECQTIAAFIAMLKRQFGEGYNWPTNLKPHK